MGEYLKKNEKRESKSYLHRGLPEHHEPVRD